MASFMVTGVDELDLSFKKLARIPNSVLTEMLEVQEKVVIKAQRAEAPKNMGKMAESIKGDPVKREWSGAYKDVYPQGVHHISKKSRYRNNSGKRTVTNAEVGFIHEYGAPGRKIKASQWMRKANEKSADEISEAAKEVYYNWLNTI